MAGKLEDLKGQLQITEALNKALEHQLGLQKQIATGMSRQAQFAKDMAGAAKKGSGLKKQITEQRSLTKELENTKQKSKDLTNELQQGMKKSAGSIGGFKDMLGGLGKFMMSWKGMTLGIFGGLIGGITKVFSGLLAAIKGIFSLITNTIKVSMGVIKSLIAAPFKMMGTFGRLAQDMHSINVVINGARQSVNGMIGDHKTLGDVTAGAYASAKKAVDSLPGGMFGPHEQGAAERIKLAGELTAAFGHYQNTLKTLGPIGQKFVVQMSKNLGFTGENIQKVVSVSKAYGKNIDEEFKTISLGIVATAKAGGLNVKTLGKDFSVFFAKLGPATGMASHKIVAMSAAFAKMGLSADTALGMFTKFDTLEGGAEVVSKMSRSLGIHVSQTQMIMAREKGPLEQLRIVQESMRSAGKSFEDLSYDGKKMIGEMFGGDQAAAMKAFGRAGMESSDSIEKAAKAAKNAKDARDMPKLMQKLNKSIQKIADSFGKIMAPFEAFTHGLTRGGKDNKFVKNMMDISTAFGKIGREVGKLLQESGFLEKMTTSLGDFAKNIKKMMPLVKELLNNLFTDQPQSKRSAWTIISEMSSKLLGAYSGFYDSIAMMVLKAAQKVVPIMIKMAAWLGETLNHTLTGALTGDWSGLKGQFSGMGSDVDFGTDALNKEWESLGEKTSTTFNETFMKKQKRWVATNGKMQMRRAGLGEALMANLGQSIKAGMKGLGRLIWDGIKEAFNNIPTPVKLYIGLALAGLFLPGGAIMVAAATALGAGIGMAVNAIGDLFTNNKAIKASEKFSAQVRKQIVQRGDNLRLEVANKIAATKGLLKGMRKILNEELTTPTSKASVAKAMSIINANKEKFNKARAKTEQRAPLVRQGKHNYRHHAKHSAERAKQFSLGGQKDYDLSDKYFQTQTFGDGKGGKEFDGNIMEMLKGVIAGKRGGSLSNLKKILDTNYGSSYSYKELEAIIKGMNTTDDGLHIETGAEEKLIRQLLIAQETAADSSHYTSRERLKKLEKDQKAALTDSFRKMSFVDRTILKQATVELRDRGDKNEKQQARQVITAIGGVSDDHTVITQIMKTLAAAELSKMKDLDDNSDFKAGLRRAAALAVDPAAEYNRLLKAEAMKRADQYTFGAKEVEGGLLDTRTIRDLGRAAELYARYTASPDALLKSDPAAAKAIDAIKSSSNLGKDAAPATVIKALAKHVSGDHLKAGAKGKQPKPDTKKLMKKVSQAGSKVKGVKVKSSKKAKALGRLPVRVLNLLASRKASKRMFGAGLEMTEIMDKLGPAAQTVSAALNSAAIPALQGTATASQQAASSLATTVVMLSYVRDKLTEVQTAYAGILETVVEVRKEADKLKGKHSAKITTETGKLEVNIHVNVDSKQISQALEKTPVVTWSGDMGSQS